MKSSAILSLLASILSSGALHAAPPRLIQSFNADWQFAIDTAEPAAGTAWQSVTLPHTAKLEPLHLGTRMWMGDCIYRKSITPKPEWKDKKVFLRFEGAMHTATVRLDGKEIAKHYGGYLPFTVDLTPHLQSGKPAEITVHLDNRENGEVPPGKPLKNLDFAWYHGLYRNVRLIVTDKLRVTDSVAENIPAGGGVFVSYPEVSGASATVRAKIHVRNDRDREAAATVRCTLTNKSGTRIASETKLNLAAGAADHAEVLIKVPNPKLWSPQSPNLYQLTTDITVGGSVVDSVTTNCGIRSVTCTASGGFVLNGKKMYLRGTNRHQEFPYLGYALSDNAHWRDAYKIKKAGFDLVRLSHYPNDTAFLDACDYYGIVVMDAIPGWQFFKAGTFADHALQNARDMIRRDRNHPSCLFWETSLNETGMPQPFRQQLHDIAKTEGPPGTFSASHADGIHDVFIPARQHTGGPKFWDDWKDKTNRDRPIFTAEYGDYEYLTSDLAFNFDQDNKNVKLKKEEVTSRQLRGDGEARMLCQARNFQEAHNQNHRNPAMIGDANWLFNDYNRGIFEYHCSSGVVDIFRLPKFVNHFYTSQRDPSGESMAAPMVYIASFWNDKSSPRVRVFSNGDEVELFLNGKSIARQKPDSNDISDRLKHPPFTFQTGRFQPGELRAVAYIGGRKAAVHVVRTPGSPSTLRIRPDLSNHPLAKRGIDTIFVYAEITDERGTVIPDASTPVSFKVSGATLASPPKVNAEAGIATAVIVTDGSSKAVTLTAEADSLPRATETIP